MYHKPFSILSDRVLDLCLKQIHFCRTRQCWICRQHNIHLTGWKNWVLVHDGLPEILKNNVQYGSVINWKTDIISILLQSTISFEFNIILMIRYPTTTLRLLHQPGKYIGLSVRLLLPGCKIFQLNIILIVRWSTTIKLNEVIVFMRHPWKYSG